MSANEASAPQKILSNAESMQMLEDEMTTEEVVEQEKPSEEYQPAEEELTEHHPPAVIYQASNKRRLWGKCFWGLDIGSHNIKIVGLYKGFNTVSLAHLAVIEIAPGQKLSKLGAMQDKATIAAILRALDALGMEQNLMAISLDRASVVIRQIQYPLAARDKLLSALQWEVRKYIPFKPDDVVVDAQIMSQSEQTKKLDVLLVAATKEHLQQRMELLEQVKVKPTIVDADPLALMNAFAAQRTLEAKETKETVVILDLGAKATTLNILSHDGHYFTLSLSVGGETFTNEIQSHCQVTYSIAESLKKGEKLEVFSLNNDKAEASLNRALEKSYDLLVKEIRQALVYYNKQTGINRFERMILTGGGAGLSGVEQYLSQKTGITTEIFNPLQGIKINQKCFDLETISALAPQLSVALGLALRWKV